SLGSNLYLLQSNADGVILVYGPITDLNSLGSPMQVQDSIVVNATFTSLTGGNLFGDFRHELVIGQRTGGLFTMKRIKDIPLSAGQEDMPSTELEWYPNPTNGTVELKPFAGLSFEPLQLQVFDVSGSLVMKKKASPTKQKGITLDLGALPNGVYTISLKNNEHSSWSRIVKQ
ncbi:MAG: T9SS type A sorting domain-containing protein, partial [Salibacteraceae bacterium]